MELTSVQWILKTDHFYFSPCGTKVITDFVLWPSFGPLLKPCDNLSKVDFKNERTTTGDKKKVSFHYTVGEAVFGPKNLIEKLG